MTRYLATRLLQALAVLVVLSIAVYGLIGLMPGDPIDLMVSADPSLSAADAARLKALYGLDRPLHERYLAWAGNALSGDLGYSRLYGQPVGEVLLPRLANSLLLMGAAVLLSIAIAVPLGVVAARHGGGAVDRAITLGCFAGVSIPPFWLALLLIILFAVTLGLLPASGAGTGEGAVARLRHLALPVATLTLASLASYTRHVRAAMLETLGEDYIRTARAKGVPERRVVWRHALGNALLPAVTVMALDVGTLLSGALVTETMFAYPGMGKLIYDTILGNDYNVALAALLAACATTLAANLAADLAYAGLDPRISLGRAP